MVSKAQKMYNKSHDYFKQTLNYDPYNIDAWNDYKDYLEFLGNMETAAKINREKVNYIFPKGYSIVNLNQKILIKENMKRNWLTITD
jgi:tetratricopeptide (TPR) repeat protein